MDRPRPNDNLGVNKSGRSIRKSPLHQSNYAANANAPRPNVQPQVYNISKNDFRSIVQQLTGSPSRDSLPRPPPPVNSPKPQNSRLHRIRPAPLTQISRPPVPLPAMATQPQPYPQFARPPQPQPSFPQGVQQQQQPMMGHGDQFWSNTAESPVSEYMRYLQSSLRDSGPNGSQMQSGQEHRPYMPPAQPQPSPRMPGHEHRPYVPTHESQPYMPGPSQPAPHMQNHGSRPYMPGPSQPAPHMPNHDNRSYMPAQSQPQPLPHMPSHEHQAYMPGPSQPAPHMPNHEHWSYMPAQSQPLPHMPGQEHRGYMPAQSQPQPQPPPQQQPHMMPGVQPRMNMQGPLPPPGLVPSPVPHNLPSPRFNGPVPVTPNLPSPRFNQMQQGGFASPRYNGFGGPLHSPTSQFYLPSPTGFSNMFSPRSPYPLLSPGVQYPPPLTPNFSFSQIAQPGSHGPGPGPGPGAGPSQPPPSPGLFPVSPSGFFPVQSPRWGDY